MKTINLYLKFSFTSLSPDAQPISLAVVSDSVKPFDHMAGFKGESSSFYAEFTDFSINRCDSWVKENVVKKLYLKDKFGADARNVSDNGWECIGSTYGLVFHLKEWLSQFKDYDIQFVTDCGWFNWYWMVQLLAEWSTFDSCNCRKTTVCEEDRGCWGCKYQILRRGLPQLPDNISPVPEDLNDLIARTKGISVREAFDLNREELLYPESLMPEKKAEAVMYSEGDKWEEFLNTKNNPLLVAAKKHNALFDAKVIKTIYNKLK